ncbi:MAG: hypothetical protein E7626_04725 [Ruminococcaceae bacterium]|nr:hypothetical protein [Oscillospiraceae bacterium]
MSFAKGFLVSFVLCFLAFAVIILYGGSFALTLIKEKDAAQLEDEQENVEDGPSSSNPVYTTHETFSFALVITDEIPLPEDEENGEGEEGGENGEGNEGTEQEPEIGPVARVTVNEEEGGGTDGGNTTPGGTGTPDGTDPDGTNPDGTNPDGTDPENPENPDTPEEPEEPEIPEYFKEFDELLAQYGKTVDVEIKFICVVSINKTARKTLITVIPGDTMIPIGEVDLNLSYVYHLSEIPEMKLPNFIASTVTATTGVIPNYHGFVDIDDFVTLADELGGVPYSLAGTINTVKKSDGSEIILPAGDLTLNGEMLSALLEYEAFGNRYGPSQALIDVAKGMLDGVCAKFRPNIIAKVRDMLEFVKTDFTPEDMVRVSEIFFSYEGSQKNCVPLLGAYERFGDEILFNPNYLGSVNKFKEYLN